MFVLAIQGVKWFVWGLFFILVIFLNHQSIQYKNNNEESKVKIMIFITPPQKLLKIMTVFNPGWDLTIREESEELKIIFVYRNFSFSHFIADLWLL